MIITSKKYPGILLSVICGLLIATFTACSDSDDALDAAPVEIVVSTGFGYASGVETRGEGSVSKESILLGEPLPLSVVRLDQVSEANASYLPYAQANDAGGVGQAPRGGHLTKFNWDIRMTFDTEEYYQSRSANNSTKLMGWYPAVGDGGSAWSVDSDGTATVRFTVDGDTDVMMSNLIEGNKTNPFSGADNRMTFNHLLTRFSVRVYTYDDEVQDLYGGVTSISFAGKKQTCIAQLPDVDAPSNTGATTTFEGTDNLPIIRKKASGNTDITEYNEEGIFDIPLLATSADNNETIGLAGYAMMAPVADKVTLIMDTGEKQNLSVSINAPDGGFTAGKSYTLAVEFKAKGLEIMDVTIQDWDLDEIIEEDI